MKNTFTITTAIDYPNGAPHLGHAYEKTVTDAYARWHRMLGDDVFFLTGTDENGQNLVKTAEKQGVPTLNMVDANVEIFKKLCADLQISFDDFIRTTETRHRNSTHKLWKTLEDKGDIYFSKYEGQYCSSCESFYTEMQAPNGMCPEHQGLKLETVQEEGFFFKTSQYQSWIIQHLKDHPNFVVHEGSRKEILARLEAEPMKDLSISRPNKGWGIEVPNNSAHVIYTWFDALINYKTATEFSTDGQPTPERSKFWPANVHVIGRDILWFHAVIWPVMLHAAGVPLPKQIYVHGMILAEDGRKMSKSLNNGIDPFDVLAKVPSDSFRYYLLRAIPASGNGAFVLSDLIQRHHSELGNGFGNLLMRMVKLYRKRFGDELEISPSELELDFKELVQEMKTLMDAREHNRALDRLWLDVNRVNAYINDQAPWGIKDESPESVKKFKAIIGNGLYGFYVLSQLVYPFIPNSAGKALEVMGQKPGTLSLELPKFTLQDPPVLFPRIE